MGRYNHPINAKVGCAVKVRYGSFADADADRWRIEGEEEYPIFVYDCEHCGGWHLTKNEPGIGARRTRAYRWRYRQAEVTG